MTLWINELKEHVLGEVRFDLLSKKIYSVDASIYEIEPLAIVFPKTQEDLLKTIQIALKHKIPIIPRGAATGTTGGCLGRGLIIDCTKYLNKIIHIDPEKRIAIVEPGVVQNKLNQALQSFGLRLGPNTSTGNRATVGGMLANNSAGAHSLRYGMMSDHILSVDLILSTGDKITLDTNTDSPLHHSLQSLASQSSKTIQKMLPKLHRKVSGYHLETFLSSPFNPSKLIAGSEGTLGVISQMTLNLSPSVKHTGICILPFHNLVDAFQLTSKILSYSPYAFEMIDHEIITQGKKSPMMRGQTDWLKQDPEVLFIVEFDGETPNEARKKLDHFCETFTEAQCIQDPSDIQKVWKLRETGLGLLLSRRSFSRAIAFIEDISLPPENLAAFMPSFLELLASYGKRAGFYGHVGAGCLHIRPYMDLRSEKEAQIMTQIMEKTCHLVKKHEGVLSGEHGDGLIRSWLNPKLFEKEIYAIFQEIKALFDPNNLMNPGKITDGTPPLKDLRISPQTTLREIPTFLSFEKEGGFALSVDMCNGNAQCRQTDQLMCPTFPAYGDERHTTRARAQSLRSVIHNRLPNSAFTSHELFEVLDLCIECKGCKTQCPSQVDMAKMKSEFLYHYQKEHGFSLRSRIFAHIGTLSYLASYTPSLANWIPKTLPGKKLLDWIGISSAHTLPQFTKTTFSSWFKKYKQPQKTQKQVLLFNDTYTEFNYPEIGIAAVQVLNHVGYKVIVLPWRCCGRPMISKGFLPEAQTKARRLVDALLPYAKKGIPIIGLEPSCISAVMDDYPALLPEEDLSQLQKHSFFFDTFLAKVLQEKKNSIPPFSQPIYLHGHCHQKSLQGMQSSTKLFSLIPQSNIQIMNTGCCGMAGSFGYEKEHVEFSAKIAEFRLLPEIKKAPPGAFFIANGLSCRSQIAHLSSQQAQHSAQLFQTLFS